MNGGALVAHASVDVHVPHPSASPLAVLTVLKAEPLQSEHCSSTLVSDTSSTPLPWSGSILSRYWCAHCMVAHMLHEPQLPGMPPE